MGLLDFLGLGAPALSSQEQQYVRFLGGDPGTMMASMDPQALRTQAAWGALGEVGARIADAYARRPITQPRPSLGAAIGSFGPAYSRGLMAGAQAQQLEQQARQQEAYQNLVAGLPEPVRPIYAAMGPDRGAASLAAGLQRDNQAFSLSPGQTRFDANGRPIASLPQDYAPIVTRDGYIFDPNVYRRTQGAPGYIQGGTLADRNNNPGNLRPPGQSQGFQNFATPEEGTAAMIRQLDLYRTRNGLNTVQGIVSRWAPPNENDTAAYIRNVSSALGVAPDAPIDTADQQTMRRLVVAMARQEGGRPLSPEVLDRGLALARNQAQAGPAASPPQALPPGIVGQLPPRQADDNAVVQVMTAEGPRWMRRADAVGQPAVPGQGIAVTVPGPNGPITMQTGPGAGTARPGNMAQPTLNRIEEQITNNTARLARLNRIEQSFDPNFLTYEARIRNWGRGFRERLGQDIGDADRQQLARYETFRSNAYTELNQTLHDMSGTAVTESEMGRLLLAAPDPTNDSPTQFRAKLQATIESVRLANARLHWYRAHGINPTFQNNDGGPVPMENMPDVIRARGAEIARQLGQQGVPNDQVRSRVRQQLMREFGIE